MERKHKVEKQVAGTRERILTDEVTRQSDSKVLFRTCLWKSKSMEIVLFFYRQLVTRKPG